MTGSWWAVVANRTGLTMVQGGLEDVSMPVESGLRYDK